MMKEILLLLTFTTVVGCNPFPRQTTLGDPEVQQMIKAAQTFPREQYGFSPLPTDLKTPLSLETHSTNPQNTYDTMIHLGRRTIAFRQTSSDYKWINEQEVFDGPNTVDTPDGSIKESICLTYQNEPLNGGEVNALNIVYFGNDPRLKKETLTLEDILPVLSEWGYRQRR